MKIIRHLLAAALLLGMGSIASAKTEAKPEAKAKTYTLHGFWTQGKPPEKIVEQAAKAVEAKMTGMTLITTPEDVDHSVEVLFRRDSFAIYVDALPLAGKRMGTALDLTGGKVPIDYAVEAAHAAQTGNAYP